MQDIAGHLSPFCSHCLDAFGLACGEVVELGAVLGDVVELPLFALEIDELPVAIEKAEVFCELQIDGLGAGEFFGFENGA